MNIYDFEAEKVNGEKVSLSTYQNDVLLIVNTASKCTFTPQFDDLQKLYEQYHNQGFTILGFPCNQFGEQEPGTNEEAEAFCKMNYGVTFPIFSKIKVNGEEAHPLYQYMKEALPFHGFDENNIQSKLLKMMITENNPEWLIGNEIKWNFTKFLFDRNGTPVKRFEPHEEKDAMVPSIEKLL